MPKDMKETASLVYGPVPSRRLGRSLGVDIVPYKTCTYDCIYCQIGRTSRTTIERKAYVTPERILSELEERLRYGADPDYITIGGSGEPSLNSALGQIIQKIRQMTDIPLAVLTNGSLMGFAEVRKDLMSADVVLPSLDAYDAASFKKINRPHPEITFQAMIRGLVDFRGVYAGQIWLEILIIRGFNDSDAAVSAFLPYISAINPDRIHINTAVRPPAEEYAGQVSAEVLQRLAQKLGPQAEVIAEFRGVDQDHHEMEMDREILDMLSRRPCTIADIADGLGLAEDVVSRQVRALAESGAIETRSSGDRIYYFRPTDNAGSA